MRAARAFPPARNSSSIIRSPAGWSTTRQEIWQSQFAVAEKVLAEAQVGPEDLAAIGITNQRETVVLWDRATGEPLHNAIVWQCRRTAASLRSHPRRGF